MPAGKTFQERRLLLFQFSLENPLNKFFTSLTSQKNFHNITVFWEYSWNIFETEIRGMFFDILVTLICNYWNLAKDLLLPNHTLLTQKQIFRQKMF